MIDGFDWFSHLAAWQVGKIYQANKKKMNSIHLKRVSTNVNNIWSVVRELKIQEYR